MNEEARAASVHIFLCGAAPTAIAQQHRNVSQEHWWKLSY